MTYLQGRERGHGTPSYLRCSVGVPGQRAHVGGWVCGGCVGCLFVCLYVGVPWGGLMSGGDGWGGGGHAGTGAYNKI
jgi:hypothetical protein